MTFNWKIVTDFYYLMQTRELTVVVHTCNPGTQEVRAGNHSHLIYMEPYLKKNQLKMKLK